MYGPQLRKLSRHKQKVVQNIMNCRTAALGGHVYGCDSDDCDHEDYSYNSCRDRNCPKCQYSAKELWVESRVRELLPVPYYHMVFTMPHLFNELMLSNRVLIFNLLFEASSYAVKELFKSRYNAQPGMISLLHTWGQNLSMHDHIHMLVPGGGLSLEKDEWIACEEKYALPEKALSSVFRAYFVKQLRKKYRKGKINFTDNIGYLEQPSNFEDLIDKSFEKDWVVYAKEPFSTPLAVLGYLGNYTHRIAFSNHRIVKVEQDRVYFKYKDYRDKAKIKVMSLKVTEFLRRFLMHVVPKKFVRIRYYGFMTNSKRKKNLKKTRQLIAKTDNQSVLTEEKIEKIIEDYKRKNPVDTDTCPVCKKGKMIVIRELLKGFVYNDSS